MIWEERCSVVLMVTRTEEKRRVKAHAYWPAEAGATRQFRVEGGKEGGDDVIYTVGLKRVLR